MILLIHNKAKLFGGIMKKILLYILVVSTLFLTACKSVLVDAESGLDFDPLDSSVPDSDIVTSDPVMPDVPDIVLEDFSNKQEAEDIQLSGGFAVEKKREGFSGTGYVTGLGNQDAEELSYELDVPQNQHYSISVCVASVDKQNNMLLINDDEIAEIITSGRNIFENIVINNVYIPKGKAKITIKSVTGKTDIDYIEVRNCDDVFKFESSPFSVPVNTNADDATVNVLKFLVANNGKKTVSGQYASVGTNREPELIHKITGKYPAIRGGDMVGYTSDTIRGTDDVAQAIKWAKKGGMISYVWHWEAPSGVSSYYSDLTQFRISDVRTDKPVALKPIDELQKMADDGEISDDLVKLIDDIDTVSQQLSRLQDNGVTVLWRPLHEASGGWFWWGASGKEDYFWLYNLLYERQTNYHKLNNLLWVWNAQDPDWYVSDSRCDIIAADIYGAFQTDVNYVNTYAEMNKISQKKLIAISECDTPPLVDNMLRDKSVWSFFSIWSGQYVMDDFGEYTESYTTMNKLIGIYNHIDTLTLDDLPDFSKKLTL